MMGFLIPTSFKVSSKKILCCCLIVLLILTSKTYGSSVTGDKRKLEHHGGGVDDHDHEEADIDPNIGLTRAPGIPPTFAPDPDQFISNNNMNGNGNDMQQMRGTNEYQERPPTMYPTGTDPYKNDHYPRVEPDNKNNYYPRVEPDLYFHYPPPIEYQYGPLPRDLPPTPYPTYVRPPTMYPTAGKPTPFPTNRMETPEPTPLPTPYPTPYRKFYLLLHLNGSQRTEQSNSKFIQL